MRSVGRRSSHARRSTPAVGRAGATARPRAASAPIGSGRLAMPCRTDETADTYPVGARVPPWAPFLPRAPGAAPGVLVRLRGIWRGVQPGAGHAAGAPVRCWAPTIGRARERSRRLARLPGDRLRRRAGQDPSRRASDRQRPVVDGTRIHAAGDYDHLPGALAPLRRLTPADGRGRDGSGRLGRLPGDRLRARHGCPTRREG